MSEHAHPTVKSFFGIWITLLILTAITTAASFLELGPFNAVVALFIATCKASLVVLFFMEARYLPKITKMVIVTALFFLGLLLTLTMTDFMTRLMGR